MSRNKKFTTNFKCLFCSNTWTDEYDFDLKRSLYEVNSCRKCIPSTNTKKGIVIRYGAWSRKPSAAIYADFHLKRGELYTVRKMKPWIHGCYVLLEGFGERTFDLSIFTPKDFVLPSNI